MSIVTNHTITVTIAGLDRTANLSRGSLFIRSNIGNTNDIAQFTLIDDGSYQILDWSEVTITVDGTRVFGGYITSSGGTASGDAANKTTFWSVECRDWSAIFDTVVVGRQYTDSADNAIVDNLFDTYLPDDGFDSTTNVATQYDDVDIVFDYVTLREALDQLADQVKAQWHVDPDKSIYWYGVIDPGAAAFDIDTVSPNNSSTFDVLADSLKATTDSLEIVNKLQIIGGYQVAGTLQTDTFTGVADEFIYGPLTQIPSSMWSISFTDETDTAYTLYASDIGTYPSTIVDDDGNPVYVDDGDYYVVANLDTQYISFDPDTPYPKAGSTITVKYYYKEPIVITREDTGSQAQYGRVFERTIFDESLNDLRMATRYADSILAEYAYGRVTVRFDVTRHGLLPGRLIAINTPAFNISTILGGLLWLNDRGGYISLEGGDGNIALENYDQARYFLIQEVAIQTVVTQQDEFAIIATVTAGRWVRTLADSIRQQQASQYKTNLRTGNRSFSSLSQITGNLGEVISGKALFTDGGTAQFQWTDYGGHTGAVVGLEDVGQPAPYGAAYILQDGTVRAKMGKMGTELAAVGTVTPDGWGIWTDNGYFSGVISANAGQIGGWTIAANAIYAAGGTISTSVPPINSSNPGVSMSTAGIVGYGTLGLTFSLPSDPAQRPIFSSGTILETVYEVTNAAVIRTGTLFPKVQIDNSGIFAYSAGSAALFTVDSATGRMTAVDGNFSGSISASMVTGGTVRTNSGSPRAEMTPLGFFAYNGSGSALFQVSSTTGRLTATSGSFSGSVTASVVTGGTVSGALVTGGTLSAYGGSIVVSDASGINLLTPSSYTDATTDNRFVRWRNASISGSIAAQVGAYTSAGTHTLYVEAGNNNSGNAGQMILRSYAGATGDWADIYITDDVMAFSIADGGVFYQPLVLRKGLISPGVSVVPTSNNAYNLGASGTAWANTYTTTLNVISTLYSPAGSVGYAVIETVAPTSGTLYVAGGGFSTGNNDFVWNSGGFDRIRLSRSNNSLEPTSDSGQSLGRSGVRWSAVWAVNGTIQTSDERKKAQLQRSRLGLAFIRALKALSWVWREGDDKRVHHGLSAQNVRDVLAALDAGDFGGYIHDPDNDTFHLAYHEFIAPLVAAIQELATRVEQLETT